MVETAPLRWVEAGLLRVVGVFGAENVGWDEKGGVWRVDEGEETVRRWVEGGPDADKVDDEDSDDEGEHENGDARVVRFEGIHELVGVRDDAAEGGFWDQWRSLVREASAMDAAGKEVVLLTYSDGSHKPGAVHEGTYGWAIRGLVGGREYDGLWGGGVVHGQHEDITSTRAEALGVLAMWLFLADGNWEYGLEH